MKWGKATSLTIPDLKLIMFGGKGGSGKTTSAAATALYLHEIDHHRKLLIMSVDPAHSLADSFDTAVDINKVTPIAENLWCLEIDAQQLLADYKARYGGVIKEIADRATYFDRQDIESFFDLSLPGLDEVMAIIRIADLLKSGEYDLIVLDTAPTGHTTVLLSLPQQMEQWIRLMDMLMEKHRYIVRAMTGRYREDECDAFIENQRSDLSRVRALLSDERTTEFVPVTIPQPISILEVESLVQTLAHNRVPVKNVIVNQVADERECPFCQSRAEQQQIYIRDLERKFASFNLVRVPVLPRQIRGRQRLMEYAQILFEEDKTLIQAMVSRPARSVDKDRHPRLSLEGRSFTIFGGKGGVGKSVIAAASALQLARTRPGQKVLIFSTDPAHSLGHVFGQNIGNRITQIGQMDNLYALEIEGRQLLEDFKRELRDDIEEAFNRFLGGSVDIKFDREIMQELLSVTPPGLDELMALRKIVDLLQGGEYDLFVLDSAASGHLLRFLELPHLAREWLNATFRLLLKYKGLGAVRFYNATERLIELSRGIREVIATLSDPQRTKFVMITIAEAMAVSEAEDLASSLDKLKIPSSTIIVNMVVPPTQCAFCAAQREEQTECIDEIEAKFPNHTVIYLPLFAQPVRGMDGLTMLARTLYGHIGEANGSDEPVSAATEAKGDR